MAMRQASGASGRGQFARPPPATSTAARGIVGGSRPSTGRSSVESRSAGMAAASGTRSTRRTLNDHDDRPAASVNDHDDRPATRGTGSAARLSAGGRQAMGQTTVASLVAASTSSRELGDMQSLNLPRLTASSVSQSFDVPVETDIPASADAELGTPSSSSTLGRRTSASQRDGQSRNFPRRTASKAFQNVDASLDTDITASADTEADGSSSSALGRRMSNASSTQQGEAPDSGYGAIGERVVSAEGRTRRASAARAEADASSSSALGRRMSNASSTEQGEAPDSGYSAIGEREVSLAGAEGRTRRASAARESPSAVPPRSTTAGTRRVRSSVGTSATSAANSTASTTSRASGREAHSHLAGPPGSNLRRKTDEELAKEARQSWIDARENAEARQRNSLGAALGSSAQGSSSATTDQRKEEQEREDALFAAALMEQELREAAEMEARHEADAMVAAALVHRDRGHQRHHREHRGGPANLDTHLALMMSMAQAEADEQQCLQDILDESRRAAAGQGLLSDENEAFARIQRQSLVEAVRSQLPTTVWTSQQAQEGQQECALCLTEYAQGDEVTRLGCLHAFHRECFDPWLEKQLTCPVCKLDLLQGDT